MRSSPYLFTPIVAALAVCFSLFHSVHAGVDVGNGDPARGCVSADEFYADEGTHDEVVLGPIKVQQAVSPNGAAMPLAIMDCNRDEKLDLFIRLSSEDAAPPARFLVWDACPGTGPNRVSFTFSQGSETATWRAFDMAGVWVDTVVSPASATNQTIQLEYVGGIRWIEVVGAEICVDLICWTCPTTTPPTNCVQAEDHYDRPLFGQATIPLGPVSVNSARFPNGDIVGLDVVDCDDDGELELSIPWSEETALTFAKIFFQPVCEGSAPKAVTIDFRHGVEEVKWVAYSPAGDMVDVEVTPNLGMQQSVTLASDDGIFYVEVVGAEICIDRICWRCRAPADRCVSADEFFDREALGLNPVDLGPVRATPATLPTGEVAGLNIRDCDNDRELELEIPWSEESGKELAKIFFRGACDPGEPTRVEITFSQGVPEVEWRAYSPGGALVDVKTTFQMMNAQTVVLESAQTIMWVEVVGAEICIDKICWDCEPVREDEPCVKPGTFFGGPAFDLNLVVMDQFRARAAVLPNGDVAGLNIHDCDDDGELELEIPWSEETAQQLARLWFRGVCEPGEPSRVSIKFRQFVNEVKWVAYAADGSVVDSETTVQVPDSQTVVLGGVKPILYVEVTGAEICIDEICWDCDPREPPEDCLEPGQFYDEAFEDETIEFGGAAVSAGVDESGAVVPVRVVDCDNDGQLEVFILESSPDWEKPAMIHLSRVCDGDGPYRVEISFRQGSQQVLWTAIGVGGGVVDAEVTLNPGLPQTVVLAAAEPIARVLVRGAEICIDRICWDCEPPREPPETCRDASTSFSRPTPNLPSIDLDGVSIHAAVLPGFVGIVPLNIRDCDDDGDLEIEVPWSEATAPIPAVIGFEQLCDRAYPVEVAITFSQGAPPSTWRAFDAGGALVDTQVAPAAGGPQTVILSGPEIRRVTIEGAEICIDEICWRCRREEEGFRRGDCNNDGTMDISDSLFSLNYLFVEGSDTPTCDDACDVNDDGGMDISDGLYGLNALFVRGAPPPPPPVSRCGEDPTEDPLDCAEYDWCDA